MRALVFSCALVACARPPSPTARQPPRVDDAVVPPAPTAADASVTTKDEVYDLPWTRRDAATSDCPLELVVTRRIPALGQRTFMLAPEETERLAVADLGPAALGDRPWRRGRRAPQAEQAFALALDKWLGDTEAPTLAVRDEGPLLDAGVASAERFSFTVHGRRVGYATCHGAYETFDWSGSFEVLLDGTVSRLTLAGSAVVREDVCGPDGRSRIVTGTYRATVTGRLEPACGVSAP